MEQKAQVIELQRALNRRLYRMGVLPEEVFSMAEITLAQRLTELRRDSTIIVEIS